MTHLTERRKADRAEMARIAQAIVAECGAECEVTSEGTDTMYPRAVRLYVRAVRGLCVHLDFDGRSCQPDVHVCPWHMSLETDACLSGAFPGEVNNFHFAKSTTVAYGFDALCSHVRKVLEMARSGEAFDAAREAAQVARNGTWQERRARWDATFDVIERRTDDGNQDQEQAD